jgi:hypothetical protein
MLKWTRFMLNNKRRIPDGLTLKDFMRSGNTSELFKSSTTSENNSLNNTSDTFTKKVYIETYGCQMNVSDSEIITSILKNSGYSFISVDKDADVILINTCAIRENAEQKIWNRLNDIRGFSKLKKNKPILGILGCMAERLNEFLLLNLEIESEIIRKRTISGFSGWARCL